MSGIKYELRQNHLPVVGMQHTARVRPSGTADLDDIVDLIVGRGSTVARSDILSVLSDFALAVATLLGYGMTVLTPVAKFRLSLGGIFADEKDGYDPSRHRLKVNAQPSKELCTEVNRRAEMIKQDASPIAPVLTSYTDTLSGEKNVRVTPGGPARLVGRLLNYDAADLQQGIFFVNSAGVETRVEVLIRQEPSEMDLLAPTLAAGEYRLEVRAVINGRLRTGALEQKLQVS